MGFCEWPVTIPAKYQSEWDRAPEADRAIAQEMAGFVLWSLTGQVFGLCEQTVRPCFEPPSRRSTYAGPTPGTYWPGVAINPAASGACGCNSDCKHVGPEDVSVPGPIHEVLAVSIDGQVVDPSLYRIRNRRWLRRIDGQVWPQQQNLYVPDDAEGAFVIRYVRGVPVPSIGQAMGGLLAIETLRGIQGKDCALPKGVTSVGRQGVNFEIDPRGYFEDGLTGVDLVDQWVMSLTRAKRPTRMSSPDSPRPVIFS